MVMKYGLDETEIENGCGLIEFNRRVVICKRISDIKLSFSECICSELTLLKNKGFVLVYTDLHFLVNFQYFLKKYQFR